MTVEFGFDVVGTYPVSLEINEEDLPENWNDMTDVEQNEWLRDNYEHEMFREAIWGCDFSIGDLDYIEVNGKAYCWNH